MQYLAMTEEAIEKVKKLQDIVLAAPQTDFHTWHYLHAGMYTRKIMITAGTVLVGALIKIPTMLMIDGEVEVFIGGETVHFIGNNIIPAQANRKQAFLAITDTYITMVFPTAAKSVEEAEDEFTNEAHMLYSRKHIDKNSIIITER